MAQNDTEQGAAALSKQWESCQAHAHWAWKSGILSTFAAVIWTRGKLCAQTAILLMC